MKYVLTIHAMGTYPEIELDQNGYESLKKSKAILSDALIMEEKYEILISNYLEFEEEILKYAALSMIRSPYEYDDFFQMKMRFNQRLVNLLTSARLYVDQLYRHVRVCLPTNVDAKGQVNTLFSQEYDASSEYRFMEALRNYVQHRGLPVHWFQFSGQAEGSGDSRELIFSTELASMKKYLQEDPKFKKSTLSEMPDKIDIKSSTRIYIEAISRVHCVTRRLINTSIEDARSIVENATASYRNIYTEECLGLHAICINENRDIEAVPLLLDWDDIRIKLTKRNPELVNLRNRYVSSQNKTDTHS